MQLSASSPKSHVVDSSILAQSRCNDPCNVVSALCFMSHILPVQSVPAAYFSYRAGQSENQQAQLKSIRWQALYSQSFAADRATGLKV